LIGLVCILWGAATLAADALVVENDNVGIGIETPTAPLHIFRDDSTQEFLFLESDELGGPQDRPLMLLRNNGGIRFQFENALTGNTWRFQAGTGNNNNFEITQLGTGQLELVLDPNGNLIIGGEIVTAGSCSGGCDLVFHEDYKLESIEDHAAQMWANSHLPGVGPTKEGEPFNLTRKTAGVLNELEKAHIYIAQLHARLKSKERQIEEVMARLEKLERQSAP
jgi:hypothetical protein